MITVITGYIDELKKENDSFILPETALHPDERVDFAIDIMKKANENIIIYTYDVFIIETIMMLGQRNPAQVSIFIKEKEQDVKKISIDDIGMVYENLSRAFDKIDKIKSENLFLKLGV